MTDATTKGGVVEKSLYRGLDVKILSVIWKGEMYKIYETFSFILQEFDYIFLNIYIYIYHIYTYTQMFVLE